MNTGAVRRSGDNWAETRSAQDWFHRSVGASIHKRQMIARDHHGAMDDTRLGLVFRAVRIRMRLRQIDVAQLAGVSQSSVSRVERGHLATLPLKVVRSLAGVLEIRLDIVPGWRGGDLERVANARHTALHEVLAHRVARSPGWESAAEVSYSIWGERGAMDRLAFHVASGMVAVFEIKPDLSDPAGLVGQADRYRRLAPAVALERGWKAEAVSCWAVVADSDTNRRRLAAHRALLRGAFPGEGLQRWLRKPVERVDGLAFIAYPHAQTGTRSLTSVKRVRTGRKP